MVAPSAPLPLQPPQPSSGQARLFVGFWPDGATRAALAAHRDRWRWVPRARPTPDAKLHLTLQFLGLQPRALMPTLVDGLKALPFEPFELALDDTDLRPRVSGGVAVLQPRRTPTALAALHRHAAQWLASLGLEPERRAYKPHVTLARHAAGSAAPSVDAPIAWTVQRPVLVESEPAPGGYRVVG